MEKGTERRKQEGKRVRFDEVKDTRLLMMSHMFVGQEDEVWSLFRDKLIYLKELYGGKHAVHLCPICLTIFISGTAKKHPITSVGSLFLAFNPIEKTSAEIAEVFKDHGRVKVQENGEILIGIPAFHQICISDHRTLEGSITAANLKQRNTNSSVESDFQKKKIVLCKREPEVHQVLDKSKGVEENMIKRPVWKPFSKGSTSGIKQNIYLDSYSSPKQESKGTHL